MSESSGMAPPRVGRRDNRPFRPGGMPPLFGDTAAALVVDDDMQLGAVLEYCPNGSTC